MSDEYGHIPGGFGFSESLSGPEIGVRGRQVIVPLPRNPTDRSTIVSIYPGRIKETKPTIYPSEFIIPAAPDDGFTLTVIGSASYYMANPNDEGRNKFPPIEVQINSFQLAQSICLDWNSGMLYYTPGTSEAGLFCIPGEWDDKSVLRFVHRDTKKTFEQILNEYRMRQKNWFRALIEQSDADWARTNGNPMAITEYARIAARILKLDKTWNKDFEAIAMANCPYCGELVNPNYPTCRHCHKTINPAKAAELDKLFGGMVKNG